MRSEAFQFDIVEYYRNPNLSGQQLTHIRKNCIKTKMNTLNKWNINKRNPSNIFGRKLRSCQQDEITSIKLIFNIKWLLFNLWFTTFRSMLRVGLIMQEWLHEAIGIRWGMIRKWRQAPCLSHTLIFCQLFLYLVYRIIVFIVCPCQDGMTSSVNAIVWNKRKRY